MNLNEEFFKSQVITEMSREMKIKGSDTDILIKSFQDTLKSSDNKEEFEKAWSKDLQAKFPSGGWRTINGASVFINGGKVVAGLGGFNGLVDDFFKQQKESGSKGNSIENKIKQRTEELVKRYYEKDKGLKVGVAKRGITEISANIEAKKRGKEYRVEPDENEKGKFKVVKDIQGDAEGLSIQEYSDKYYENLNIVAKHQIEEEMKSNKEEIKQPEKKEEPKKEHQELTSSQQEIVDAFNKDKKGFVERSVNNNSVSDEKKLEGALKMKESTDNPKYIEAVDAVIKELERKLDAPNVAKKNIEEKEKGMKKFIKEDSDDIDIDKLLQGDVVANFKEIKDYNKAVKDSKKDGLIGIAKHQVMYGRDMPLDGKTALIEPKPVKVKETDIETALKNVVAIDPLRPKMEGIHYNPEGYIEANDGHKLISIKTDVGDKAGKIINPKTGKEIDDKYPNTSSLLNFENNKENKVSKFKLSELHAFTNQAKELRKEHPLTITEIEGITPKFDPQILNETIESLRKLGVEDVEIYHQDSKNQLMGIKGKNSKGQEVKAIVMPKMGEAMKYENNKWVETGKKTAFTLKQK